MNLSQIPELVIGNKVARLPIIQGGMGIGISLSNLASAVAREGGIGVISATGIGMLEDDFNRNFKEANKRALRKEIKKTRGMTDGIIGLNIMIACTDYFDLLEVAAEEKVDMVFLGSGLPLNIPQSLLPSDGKNSPVNVVPIVSSARSAQMIFQYWARHYNHVPDAVVVEGPLAGGHLGFKKEQIDNPDYQLEKIVPEVIAAIKPFELTFNKNIPVIAAGGIFTGADIYKFMRLGAQGVQMATRFVATHECDAAMEFKQAYLNCTKDDLAIIDSPVGLPGRAILNRFLKDAADGIKKPFKCPWHCLRTCNIGTSLYCICAALTNARKGFLEKGFAFAGANAYRIESITSVRELVQTLLAEYRIAASGELINPA